MTETNNTELKYMLELLIEQLKQLKAKNAELELKLSQFGQSQDKVLLLSSIADVDSTRVLSGMQIGSTDAVNNSNISEQTKLDVQKCIDFILKLGKTRPEFS